MMGYLQRTLLILTVVVLSVNCLTMPETQTSVYDPIISKKYATYSSIAFCPRTCIQSWSCGSGAVYPRLVNVTYIENSLIKAAGYIGYDPSTESIVISWRGSDNVRNWIEDLSFEVEQYVGCSGCYIHTGFYTDYKLSEKKLLAAANAIIRFYKVSKILCTGHSLGAALALINGMQFAHQFSDIPVEVHNFGQPRVGNILLARYMMQKISTIYRVVHNRDLVPHIPPQVEYHHPAYEVFFGPNMTIYKVCSSTGEDKTCSNQFFPNYDTNDHDFYFISISSPKC